MEGYDFDLGGGEEFFDLGEAARRLGRLHGRDRALHANQVRRYAKVGVRGITLPTLLIGGRRLTSAGAIQWWICATNAADAAGAGGSRGRAAPLSSRERSRLAEAGIDVGVGG